ncbi:MAG: FAD-dependent oxidoreductase [Victivallales bacterium]|jgi:hypothetical protein
MKFEPSLHLPVFCEVDVLVVGASSAAVAAALEVRRRGRTAMVISDLSYFGEESAGTLNLWPDHLDKTDTLVNAMFSGKNSFPSLPCHVKRTLESALLRASVRFLYLARPVAILRGEDGRLAGVIVAARTSLFVIRCSAIVDATRYGTLARLAGTALKKRDGIPQTLSWVVLSDGVPAGWEDHADELRPPFRQRLKDGEVTHGAYRLKVSCSALGDDSFAREHLIRASMFASNVLVTADIIPDIPSEICSSSVSLSDNPGNLYDSSFAASDNIFLLNGLLPLTSQGVSLLERSDVQVSLGYRVGALSAGSLGTRKRQDCGTFNVFTGGGIEGEFRFAPAFLRRHNGMMDISPMSFPLLGRYDVVVAGGGTGGASAGISAARAGAKTVVLDIQHKLGGVGTAGIISAYWFGNRVGFTSELDNEVMRLDQESLANGGRIWRPEIKAGVLQKMLGAAGGTAWMGSYAFGVRLSRDKVDGVLVSTPFGCGLLEAGAVVDSTGNADIAAAAGAPCRVMGAEHLATQGAGLSPRPHPGIRCFNSDYTFTDETDPEGVTAAFVRARAKFPDSFDTTPIVNSRERRQIIGDYEVSPLDILAKRTFPDTVFTACSNFDTHGFIVHPVFMVAEPDHHSLNAHVPFRCMLPQGIEGVIVTGLGMSAHRDALPVLRMQADVQNQGFAAGLAAAWSSKGSVRLRDLDIRALQRQLAELGILAADVPEHVDSFPLGLNAISEAAAADLKTAMNAAILFTYPVQSSPMLIKILNDGTDKRRIDAALILGLTGFREAAALLADTVCGSDWDEGWNYRGMGQFGASMSKLDVQILALARTREPVATGVLEAKIRKLDGNASFSHCRVAALASMLLRNSGIAAAIHDLLCKPGMQGHAQTDLFQIVEQANSDPVETEARNSSLRELYLARGLYLAGDCNGLGRAILEKYTCDLRGHYARHARAVLEQSATENLSLDIA